MKALTENDKNAIAEFLAKLRKILGEKLVMVKLFGSKARGDDDPFSDIDLFVVARQFDRGTREAITPFVVDINLKYNVVLSPIIHSLAEYEDPRLKITPFFKKVMSEGIPL